MLRPCGDRVIVKPDVEEERTAGGILLPDTAKERPQWGEVVAVGPGKWDESGAKRIPVDVKVGDKVIFASRRHRGQGWCRIPYPPRVRHSCSEAVK